MISSIFSSTISAAASSVPGTSSTIGKGFFLVLPIAKAIVGDAINVKDRYSHEKYRLEDNAENISRR